MPRSPRAQVVYYFCDETSFNDQWMAVGGLAVPDFALPKIEQKLIEINASNNVFYEVKWNSTKDRENCGQTAYADYLAKLVHDGSVHLHVRFAPFDRYDHRSSGPRKRVDTTSKMHYQLLLHRALRHYGRVYKLQIRADGGDCTKALSENLGALIAQARTQYGVDPNCISSLEQRDSDKEPLLQLLDVTLGAFAALRNERPLGAPKQRLAERIRGLYPDLDLSRNYDDRARLSIWNAVPSRRS